MKKKVLLFNLLSALLLSGCFKEAPLPEGDQALIQWVNSNPHPIYVESAEITYVYKLQNNKLVTTDTLITYTLGCDKQWVWHRAVFGGSKWEFTKEQVFIKCHTKLPDIIP